MEVINKKIGDLKPYEKNPRKNDKAVKAVAKSITEFGFKVPIVIDSQNVIVCGHTRYKASKQLGLDTVPCVVADDLTEEQIKAFRIADNKTNELADWDMDLLSEEIQGISELDMTEFGFDVNAIIDGDNKYTKNIKIPQYEITGEKPDLVELVDLEKTEELLVDIENSKVSPEEKDFLRKAAQRHLKFNYSKVAEYYAHADKEMQELMEKSALVIIDLEDAIANGYVKLSEKINKLREESL